MSANKSRINTSHKQNYSTCLLSSFSVIGNYFIQDNIELFFKNYYEEFITYFNSIKVNYTWPEFGHYQSQHINKPKLHNNKNGYQIIYDLYASSQQSIFIKCRKSFFSEKITLKNGIIQYGTFNKIHINEFLNHPDKNTIMNLFINQFSYMPNDVFNHINMHSITVYYDNYYYFHDTNNPQSDQKLPTNWWDNDRIGDIIIYWSK